MPRQILTLKRLFLSSITSSARLFLEASVNFKSDYTHHVYIELVKRLNTVEIKEVT